MRFYGLFLSSFNQKVYTAGLSHVDYPWGYIIVNRLRPEAIDGGWSCREHVATQRKVLIATIKQI